MNVYIFMDIKKTVSSVKCNIYIYTHIQSKILVVCRYLCLCVCVSQTYAHNEIELHILLYTATDRLVEGNM